MAGRVQPGMDLVGQSLTLAAIPQPLYILAFTHVWLSTISKHTVLTRQFHGLLADLFTLAREIVTMILNVLDLSSAQIHTLVITGTAKYMLMGKPLLFVMATPTQFPVLMISAMTLTHLEAMDMLSF